METPKQPKGFTRSEQFTNGKWVAYNCRKLMSSVLKETTQDSLIALDLGCGKGRYLKLLKERMPNRQMIGVDISVEELKIAKKLNPDKNFNFVIADAGKLPFKEKCFDFIILKDLLHHLDQPILALDEIGRVGKDRIAIIEANRRNTIMLLYEKYDYHHHFTDEQFRALMPIVQLNDYSMEQIQAYPFTLRLPSANPVASIWNASISGFLLACNKMPILAKFGLGCLSLVFDHSFNFVDITINDANTETKQGIISTPIRLNAATELQAKQISEDGNN
jgi:ubiquinone/menaquinone biosynthesis C-methylase UbiE